jgi:hypothetical protein
MEMRNPYDPKKSVKSIGDVSKKSWKKGSSSSGNRWKLDVN